MSRLLRALDDALQSDSVAKVFDLERWHDAGQLKADIAAVRATLFRMGVTSGEQVMVAVPNSYAFVVSYLACLYHGAVVVPINPETPAAELSRVMERFSAQAALVVAGASDAWAGELEASGFVKCETNHTDGLSGLSVQSWSLQKAKPGLSAMGEPSDDTPAVLMFTSGTTGKPKGVLLQHRHLFAAANNVIGSHELTERDVAYCILPLFHINAQVIVLLSTILSGGRVVMCDKFHASSFWEDIRRHGVTWVSCVPTILSILTKLNAPKEAAKGLRFFRSASAPLTPAIGARIEAMYDVPVIESYGMTEAAGQICVNPLPPGVRKSGSVGKPYGLSLAIVDADHRPLPAYELGEIAIRGNNVIEAYVGMEPSPDEGYGEGWIYTGDLGYQDDDGYVYITGRAKEIINRAGEKLSPREIEDVLNAHEDVARSAVVGLPDAMYGERVVAWVVPQDPDRVQAEALRESLHELCATHLAKHKCPSQIVIARSLPVNATGKVQKHILREIEPRDMLA
ncbi:AMP-binding protein [Alicyclobacillus hesperidum]|uniref:AMP-binding protein n=1 Tax=Alicyclobacillus hesperidum TaxID=89784 RepID=UPI0002DDD734|nr:AMP-binding protein [Alicyclobacillus hesperidum]